MLHNPFFSPAVEESEPADAFRVLKLEALVRMEHWLRTPGERELTERDRQIVQPLLQRLGDEADMVAQQVLGPKRKYGDPGA